MLSYCGTLKECLGPKVGYGEPQNGDFVKLVDDAPVEGQYGGQVVQLTVKPLSDAKYHNKRSKHKNPQNTDEKSAKSNLAKNLQQKLTQKSAKFKIK